MTPLVVVRNRQLLPAAGGGGGGGPSEPVAGYKAWWKADGITGLVDNDPVSAWADASANAFDLGQADSARQPTYKTAVVNGKPVVRFDGTADSMFHSPAAAGDIFNQNVTVFAVLRLDPTPGTGIHCAVAGTGGAGGTSMMCVARRDDAGGNWFSKWTDFTTYEDSDLVVSLGEFVVLTWWEAASLSPNSSEFTRLRANKVDRRHTTGSRSGVIPKHAYVGSHHTGAAYQRFFKGDVAEVLVYSSSSTTGPEQPLTLTQVEETEDYLMTKYAIS